MATFRVGQRVRVRADLRTTKTKDMAALGMETVITGARYTDWLTNRGAYPTALSDSWGEQGIYESALTPLTDPAADAFMERMKKLGKEPINDAPKVTERIEK